MPPPWMRHWHGAGEVTESKGGGNLAAPISLEQWYATDEDVLVLAPDDFEAVLPADTVVAMGSDGEFAPGSFTLTSLTNDFAAQGVVANMVVQLFELPGQRSVVCMAVESVNENTMVLRRPGKPIGWGQPPIRAGADGIEFKIATLAGIMEDIAYKLHQRYGVDPKYVCRSPENITDLRVFRRVTVFDTLLKRYISVNRSKAGDFDSKIAHYAAMVQDELNTIAVRWGENGDAAPPTTGQVRFER